MNDHAFRPDSVLFTNLGALKIVLDKKRFLLYLGFVFLFALVSGGNVHLFFPD